MLTIEYNCNVCKENIEDAQGYICAPYSDGTEPFEWQFLHYSCDPNKDSNDYWYGVESLRTLHDIGQFIDHISDKYSGKWVSNSNVIELLTHISINPSWLENHGYGETCSKCTEMSNNS